MFRFFSLSTYSYDLAFENVPWIIPVSVWKGWCCVWDADWFYDSRIEISYRCLWRPKSETLITEILVFFLSPQFSSHCFGKICFYEWLFEIVFIYWVISIFFLCSKTCFLCWCNTSNLFRKQSVSLIIVLLERRCCYIKQRRNLWNLWPLYQTSVYGRHKWTNNNL